MPTRSFITLARIQTAVRTLRTSMTCLHLARRPLGQWVVLPLRTTTSSTTYMVKWYCVLTGLTSGVSKSCVPETPLRSFSFILYIEEEEELYLTVVLGQLQGRLSPKTMMHITYSPLFPKKL